MKAFKKRPQSKPDAAVKGSTENPEIHVETKSIVVVVDVDIGIFMHQERNAHKRRTRTSCMLEGVLKGFCYNFLTILPSECFPVSPVLQTAKRKRQSS